MISPRCPASILPPAWSGSSKELKSSQNLAYFISMSKYEDRRTDRSIYFHLFGSSCIKKCPKVAQNDTQLGLNSSNPLKLSKWPKNYKI
jgi:hypothetical protein